VFLTKITRTLLLVAALFVLVGAAQPAIAAPSPAPAATADFSIAANPTSVTIKRGQTALYNIHVQGVNGFNGSVNFTVKNVSNHDFGFFTNVPVVGTGDATLHIHSAGHQSPIGTAHVIVTGTSGSLSHSITVLYTVSF
jgi:polyisoprenoid-binding protein YceI